MSAAPASAADVPMSVVAAIRYLQVEGTSHGHLYLFDREARVVRQLTNDDSGQDHDPVFSKDGREIVYQRLVARGEQGRSILTSGKADHPIKEPPQWRVDSATEPSSFDYPPSVPIPGRPGGGRIWTAGKAGDITFKLRDGSVELVLKDDKGRQDPGDPSWFPKTAYLNNPRSGDATSLESLPVLSPKRNADAKEFWAGPLPQGLVANEERKNEELTMDEPTPGTMLVLDGSPFLIQPPLRAAFFSQHRGSTFGEALFAVDLNTRKLFELAPNGGRITPLPGLPMYACVCSQRYLPLGDGRTVNCSYLDLWDGQLRRTRFAEEKTAVFYGASVFVEGKTPIIFSSQGAAR